MTNFEKDVFRQSLIFHIPHSSVHIPFTNGFDLDLIQNEINLLTDFDTDLIFNVPNTKQIITPFSRIFCDVERLPDEQEVMYQFGRGFYYTHTDNGDILRYFDKDVKETIWDEFYARHHRHLNQMIEQCLDEVGFATIIDCHSFSNIPFKTDLNQNLNRPDICIGTNSSTPSWLLNMVESFFRLNSYTIGINFPYSGTIVPKSYENLSTVNSIMIEINRDLYMENGVSVKSLVQKLNSEIIEIFS